MPVQTYILSKPLQTITVRRMTSNKLIEYWVESQFPHIIPGDVIVQCEVVNCHLSYVNSIASENRLFTDLFLPEGAVTEGGVTPVRDQTDGVPRFAIEKTRKTVFNKHRFFEGWRLQPALLSPLWAGIEKASSYIRCITRVDVFFIFDFF